MRADYTARPMSDLTPRQRQHLKGLAHHLDPVVHIGKDGLSDAVRQQVDDALDRHELIKVRLADSAPLDRDQASEALPGSVGAFLVQNIGRVFVLYRPHPEKPRIELPWPVEPEDDDSPRDLEEARAPRPREASLLGSVRDRGARPAVTPLTPPPRPVFQKPEGPGAPRNRKPAGGKAKAKPRTKKR